MAQDCLGKLTEEAVHTHAYSDDTARVTQALEDLENEFPRSLIDQTLLREALSKTDLRFDTYLKRNESTVDNLQNSELLTETVSDYFCIGNNVEAHYSCKSFCFKLSLSV